MLDKVGKRGITLIEVLIVISIIGLLSVVLITAVFRKTSNSYDAVRKSDLKIIKLAFEDYYNDHQNYPPASVLEDYCDGGIGDTILSEYLDPIPCDPQTGESYLYTPYPNETERTGGFRVFAKLNQAHDRDIAMLGCSGEAGCGVTGQPEYNYGVSEGVRVSLFVPEVLGEGEDEVPALPASDLCDPTVDLACYVCVVDSCNVCNPNAPIGDRCPESGAYSSLSGCVDNTSCDR